MIDPSPPMIVVSVFPFLLLWLVSSQLRLVANGVEANQERGEGGPSVGGKSVGERPYIDIIVVLRYERMRLFHSLSFRSRSLVHLLYICLRRLHIFVSLRDLSDILLLDVLLRILRKLGSFCRFVLYIYIIDS